MSDPKESPTPKALELGCASALRAGRCGDRMPGLFASTPPVNCALLAGHAGWHRGDEGAEWVHADEPLPERSDLPVGQQELTEVEQLRREIKMLSFKERSAHRYALEAEKEAEEAAARLAAQQAELSRLRAERATWDLAKFDAENPAVLAARVRAQTAEDLWAEAQRLREEDWPAKIGIEYVEGFEAAVAWIEREAPAAPAESVVAALPDVVGTPGVYTSRIEPQELGVVRVDLGVTDSLPDHQEG